MGHTEVLKVQNWLQRPQRFKVIVDRKQADKSTALDGPEYLDVPAFSSKDYKLNVMAYTTAAVAADITFKNEATGEYMFYELRYTAGAPPRQGTLSLECPVRTKTSTKVRCQAWSGVL